MNRKNKAIRIRRQCAKRKTDAKGLLISSGILFWRAHSNIKIGGRLVDEAEALYRKLVVAEDL